MTEEFLHHLWKYRLFDSSDLKTATGEKIKIIKTGTRNTDAGPDFFDARVKIGNTLWAGNVEIHVNSSSWKKHNHHNDSAYNNVILHVVYNDDAAAKTANNNSVQTLSLKNKFDKKLFFRYEKFLKSKLWIPCENQIASVDEFVKNAWLERLAVERLERKSKIILDDLKLYNNDWSEVFYIHLARNFGLKINSEPFVLLAKSLPHSILGKHKDNLFQLESLLFGQAGFLEKQHIEKYASELKKEYLFLQKKYSLKPVDAHLWKFLRLRPVAFPTIRISQFANLIYQSTFLFSKIIQCENVKDIQKLFSVSASEFWNIRYTFETVSAKKTKRLGKDMIQKIIINTLVPFLFVYGKQKGNSVFQERAIKFLEKLPPEKNSITGRFKKLNFKIKSAMQSQSLLELKHEYCDKKKCLECAIGNRLLKR